MFLIIIANKVKKSIFHILPLPLNDIMFSNRKYRISKKKKKKIQDFILYLQRVDGGEHTASSFQGLIF